MRNIKLILEYDGAKFSGFQKQPGRRTVQSELEKALKQIFKKSLKISAASGRTDAGVHAKGQVVNFKTNSEIPVYNIHRALNTYLPPDLSAEFVQEMPAGFSARFSAKTKVYQYLIWNRSSRSALKRLTHYHFPHPLDVTAMKKAAKLIVGKHDFRSFQAKADGRDSVRTIKQFSIIQHDYEIRFLVEGNGFLYNMVRNFVGTLIMVGTGKLSVKQFEEILKAKDRRHIGPTAPAHGLTLLTVKY